MCTFIWLLVLLHRVMGWGVKIAYEAIDVLPFPNPKTRGKLEKTVSGVHSLDLPINGARSNCHWDPIFQKICSFEIRSNCHWVLSTIQRWQALLIFGKCASNANFILHPLLTIVADADLDQNANHLLFRLTFPFVTIVDNCFLLIPFTIRLTNFWCGVFLFIAFFLFWTGFVDGFFVFSFSCCDWRKYYRRVTMVMFLTISI